MNRFSLCAAFLAAVVLPLVGCNSNPPVAAPAQNAPAGTAPGTSTGDPQAGSPGSAPNGTGTAAPAPVEITAPAGTRVAVRITETLSASRNEVGDGFSGVLEAPVVSRGETLFERGTRVTGEVVASKGRGRFKGSGALGIEVTTIGGVRVHTAEYEKELKGKGKRTGGFIAGGAGLGALIGGIAGGGKGAAIGAAAGAGAGTAGAAYTGNKDIVIPSESLVAFHLAAPVTVTR